jgi:IclR family transcriptional regulator, pca regulon regulatory protein
MAAPSEVGKRPSTPGKTPKQSQPKESDSFVRAIARGFAVIEGLGQPPGRHTLSEAAQRAGLNRAATRRILATLVAMKYCASDGRYFQLRPRSLGLGMSYLNALPFWAHSHRIVESLRDETSESCALAVLDEDDIVYIQRWPSRRILSANLGVGSRLPAYVVSLGRVMLAALPPADLDQYLARTELRALTPRTIHDPKALRDVLRSVADEGYAWVDGELDPAICGMAVPVRNANGIVVAAISVNTISGTITEAGAKRKFLRPLQRAAQELRMQMPSAPG